MKKHKIFIVMICLWMLSVGSNVSSKSLRVPAPKSAVSTATIPEQSKSESLTSTTAQPLASSVKTVSIGQDEASSAQPQSWLDWGREKADFILYIKSRIDAEKAEINNVVWDSFTDRPNAEFELLVNLDFFDHSEKLFKNQITDISDALVKRYQAEKWSPLDTIQWALGTGQEQKNKEDMIIRSKFSPQAVIEKIQELCNEKNYSSLAANFNRIIEGKIRIVFDAHGMKCRNRPFVSEAHDMACIERHVNQLKTLPCGDYSEELLHNLLGRVLREVSRITENYDEVIKSKKHTIYDLKMLSYQDFKSKYKDLFDIMEKVKQELQQVK